MPRVGGGGNKVADVSCVNDDGDGSGRVHSTGSTGSIQLDGIGTPVDSTQLLGNRTTGTCSLMIVVPLVAVLFMVTIVSVSLAPRTALWFTSLGSMTGTCSSSITKQMNVYRKLLIERSISSLTFQMNIPPEVGHIIEYAIPEAAYTSLVPLHDDLGKFQITIRALARQFSMINNMIASWVNTAGEHFYVDRQSQWGCFDSGVGAGVVLYAIENGVPTDKVSGGTSSFNLTTRPWWINGLSAWNGSWTSVYMSQNTEDGRVIAYTLRPSVSVPVVIQNGVAFLAEDKTLKLISGSVGIPILTETGGDMYAMNSSYDTVREATQQWLNNSADGTFRESHFMTVMDKQGNTFVDAVPIKVSGGLVLWLFLITPEKDFIQEMQEKQSAAVDDAYASLWVLVAVEVFLGIGAVIISMMLSITLARTLSAVERKLKRVSNGQLTKCGSSKDINRSLLREIDSLTSEVVVMQSALESFSQYVRYLCKNHMKPVVGVNKMHCTVMFLDVVDFTRTMEQYGVQTVIEILSTMFESFSTIICKNSGCIDKYIGDAIMALWGCPSPDNNSEIKACQSAAEILADMERLNAIFKAKGFPTMSIRLGLHSGEVSAGNVGSSQRLNFTVLGNTVNLASRLEPLNKELHTSVLVSDSIRDVFSDTKNSGNNMFSWRALGHIQVRGFRDPVLVHEFLGFTSRLNVEKKRLLNSYSIIDQRLYNKISTPHDISQSLDNHIAQYPDDITAAQARKMLATSSD
ncbi:adenylate cyclase [Pelomyxa schiedti]|nr:adenylate cyclase [Pelomyxa schiedti]